MTAADAALKIADEYGVRYREMVFTDRARAMAMGEIATAFREFALLLKTIEAGTVPAKQETE